MILILALIAACGDKETSAPNALDVVLAGGTVYNGLDEAPIVADVGIAGERIVAIGDLDGRPAVRRIDVSGLAVMPGIIDIHSHAIRPNAARSGLYLYPDAESLVRQGVTTVIGGPDGRSPLPIADDFARLEADPPAINYGTFVGHNSVRARVMGNDDRHATEKELQAMRDEVHKAMQSGAFGLSSGLLYTPGKFAPEAELIELARVVGEYGGIYISHMRDEALGLLDSVRETINIGEQAGIPAQITHHKAMGAPMWGRAAESLALVDAAVSRGVDVTSDQYPYPASSTGFRAVFPRWALAGGGEAIRARLENPQDRVKVKEGIVFALVNERGGNDPSRVVLADCDWDPSLNGLDLAEVLRQRETDVTIENAAELIMDLELAGGCQCVYHAMSDDDVDTIMLHSRTMIASDAGIVVPGTIRPHPRYYGTFPRVLGRYVRERGLLPLETAIHKMTRMPADRLGIKDRGRIEVGAFADIAVFAADTIIDKATFEDPNQYAEGIHHVFVNGVAVLLDGKMSGARHGAVLRGQ